MKKFYDYKIIKSAIAAGIDTLIAALRTNNLYPPGIYAEKIAAAVTELLKSKDKESIDLFFDDRNLLAKKRGSAKVTEQLEDDTADLDEMLDDDYDETLEEKDDLKELIHHLKWPVTISVMPMTTVRTSRDFSYTQHSTILITPP